MKIKELTQEELEAMGYDEIAYLILQDAGKKMKILDLFSKVCKVLNLPESTIENRIGDFFELLSINKKFVLLPKGYWDLATNHVQNMVIEDEEEDELSEDAYTEEDVFVDEEEEENIFYDDELDNEDDGDDELKDFVVVDDDNQVE